MLTRQDRQLVSIWVVFIDENNAVLRVQAVKSFYAVVRQARPRIKELADGLCH
jgi:hypothetical protein